MSDDDVHPDEMNAPHDFDDAAAEALISGHGQAIDPQLAGLVGDMRVAYTSQPPALGAELSALITTPAPAHTTSAPRRFERMRSSVIAKIGAATATLIAATGGLAVAHALPAPVQDAVSQLGIGTSAHHGRHRGPNAGRPVADPTTVDPTATTMPDTTTLPTVTTIPEGTTVPGVTTSTTVEPGEHDGNNEGNDDNNACGDHEGNDDGDDGTVSTTVPVTPGSTVACVPTTNTTVPQGTDGHGDGHDGGDDNNNVTTTTTPNANGGGDHGGHGGHDSSGDNGSGSNHGGGGSDGGSDGGN